MSRSTLGRRHFVVVLSWLALAVVASRQASADSILWLNDSGGRIGKVNITTGAVSVIGTPGILSDIAFDPAGNFWGLGFNAPQQLYRINKTNGAVTLVGSSGLNALNSLTFSSGGTLYAASNSPVASGRGLYTLNTATGAGTLVGLTAFSSSGDIAFNGGNLYMSADLGLTNDALVRLNTATGAGTQIGSFNLPDVFGVATGPDGILYGTSGTKILSINTSTGAGTQVLDYSGKGLATANGAAFETEAVAVVPLPSVFWSSGLALFGWLAASRFAPRRRPALRIAA